MKQKIAYIVFVFLLYLFLFDPPFYMFRGALRFSNILLVIALLYHCTKIKNYLHFLRNLRRELQLFLFLSVFIIVRSAFEMELSHINRMLMAFLNIFMVVPFFLQFSKEFDFCTEEKIARALMLTCTIASFISIACLTNPALYSYIKFSVIQVSENDYLYNNEYRGFGLASYLTSNYGFILGFIAGMGCFYIKENKWFLFCIPFVVIAGLINCRTSILITSSIIAILLFFERRTASSGLVVLFGVIFVLNFSYFLTFLNTSDRTLEWLTSFRQQIAIILSGEVSGTEADDLFGRMIIWPEFLEQWFVGRGYDIFINKSGAEKSDVGWIRQLNYGGIMYLLLFYSVIMALLKRIHHSGHLSFLLVFIVTYCIANTKTLCYPGDTLFVLLMFFYIMKVKKGYMIYNKIA